MNDEIKRQVESSEKVCLISLWIFICFLLIVCLFSDKVSANSTISINSLRLNYNLSYENGIQLLMRENANSGRYYILLDMSSYTLESGNIYYAAKVWVYDSEENTIREASGSQHNLSDVTLVETTHDIIYPDGTVFFSHPLTTMEKIYQKTQLIPSKIKESSMVLTICGVSLLASLIFLPLLLKTLSKFL